MKLASLLALALSFQETAEIEKVWDVTLARGETRDILFSTSEGTFMSVDVSPDGTWIVFDLLAHVYRLPISGGEASCLTQDSGVATNYHPAISPDGARIAFVSDRKGQNNLWIMDADGSNPRAVFTDDNVRVFEPVWTPDGDYVIVRRQELGDRRRPTKNGLWMYHREGGTGVELVGQDVPGAAWPSVSSDGAYVYFHATDAPPLPSGYRDPVKGYTQIRRLERATGTITPVTEGRAEQQIRSSSGGGYAAEVSPDGRYLSFARRIPDGTISYKGHRFGPRTALWRRELVSGAERLLMDPIEVDMAEGMKTLRVLPGYSWSSDGSFIVISQGGKLRKLNVESGAVETIPFTARVERTISEMTRASFRVSDGPFPARFLRWATTHGATIAFQAVGKIWTVASGGTPRRLTPASFEPFEYAPAWSPDGSSIAFTTWDVEEGGHLYRVGASGGTPQRLTRTAGEYVHPVWSPDGSTLVVARGSGATARHSSWAMNAYYDLVAIPASGGDPTPLVRVEPTGSRAQIVRASFGPDGRLFYPEPGSEKQEGNEIPFTLLVSVRPDGTDRREHLKFHFADEIVPSPDGKRVAFQEGDNVYVAAFPYNVSGKLPIEIDKRKGSVPVTQVSLEGGLYPRWLDANQLEYGSANRHFVYDVTSGESETTEVDLRVPRRLPGGTIALVGARVITPHDGQVYESATIVVDRARIACLGPCDTSAADRTIDLSGKTIIPGLVDMHAHHYREHRGIHPARDFEKAIYLAYGVTTNLDNSMWSQNVFPAAELIEAGLIVGPRTFSTGDPLYRGDGPRQNELGSYEVTEQNIERLASWGATAIKQYLQPRRDQRQWVSDIARKKKLMVTAEGSDLAYNLSMIMDGQTAWEHPMSYMPIYGDAAKFFGLAGAVYSPTFIVGGPGPWNEEYFFQKYDVWKDEKQRRWLPWRQLVPHTRRRMLRPETDYSFPLIAQGLADIIEQGGHGAIGSHGQQHGIAPHWEVWMAASALGPMGALHIATADGAHFLGAEQDLGSLEAGKLADLIVLGSNPLDAIENTLDMLYVMKGGVLYEADTLDEIWPEERPFGERFWVDEDALQADEKPIER
ncbi:MAG TPA: amidohydrolase family protein [Vicinamibacteria bacterium]|nr:amidohydrolase family protein [Vicinamibacteria bacterium]